MHETTPMNHGRLRLRCGLAWRTTGWSSAMWVSGGLMLAAEVTLAYAAAPAGADLHR